MRFLSVISVFALAGFCRAVVGPGTVTGNTAVDYSLTPILFTNADCAIYRSTTLRCAKTTAGNILFFVCHFAALSSTAFKKSRESATAVGIEIRTSTDRIAWTLVGKVWPNGASWTDAYTGTSNG